MANRRRHRWHTPRVHDTSLTSDADEVTAMVVGESASAPLPTAETAAQRAGPMSALLARTDRLPGAGWWVFVAFGIAIFAWGQAIEWATGRMPVGTFDLNLVVTAPYGPFVLLTLGVGIRVVRRALVAFWPATGWPEGEQSGWVDRFALGGFWPECAALLAGVAGGVASLLGAPAQILGPEPERGPVYAAFLPAFLAGYALSAAGVLTTLRWLRLVSRIHREATAIDVFDRAPIYAFSRVTVLVGLTYLFTAYYSFTFNAAFQAGNAASLAFIASTMAVAVAAFVVPMWGIHDRLARERERLLRDVERRTNELASELYARIDAGQFDATAVINSSMSGLTALRERTERLPTWPWPPQLLRGFVSALLLPLAVFILTRVISDLI